MARGVAISAVPERIDRQHLHVDGHRVHFLEALLDDDEVLRDALDRRQHLVGVGAHQIDGFMKIAMRVRIHGQDALAADLDRQARRLRLCPCRIQHAATAKGDTGRGRASQKISTGGHSCSLDGIAGVSHGRSIEAPARSSFLLLHIAKPEATGQSFSAGLRPSIGTSSS
jgi:hypothetical protein